MIIFAAIISVIYYLKVAGKLEIRVVPKETKEQPNQQTPRSTPPPAQRPQTLSPQKPPPSDTPATNNKSNNEPALPPASSTAPPSGGQQNSPKVKLERTKSILKQTSKERTENTYHDLQSPKRESITFAADIEVVKPVDKKSDDSNNGEKEKKSETESSSTTDKEGGEKRRSKNAERRKSQDSPRKLSIVKCDSNSHLDFEPVEALRRSSSAKALPKPLERVKINLEGNTKSDSSSSTQERSRSSEKQRVQGAADKKCVVGSPVRTFIANDGVEKRVSCSPGVDLTSHPAVTFVSGNNSGNSGIQEHR